MCQSLRNVWCYHHHSLHYFNSHEKSHEDADVTTETLQTVWGCSLTVCVKPVVELKQTFLSEAQAQEPELKVS